MVELCGQLAECGDWDTEKGEAGVAGEPNSTTLLHLAASLGLARLVCSLLHWAAEQPGRRLGREVDALARDSEGFTPLVSRAGTHHLFLSVNTEQNKRTSYSAFVIGLIHHRV